MAGESERTIISLGNTTRNSVSRTLVQKLFRIFSSTFHKAKLKVQIQPLLGNFAIILRLASLGVTYRLVAFRPNSSFLGTLAIRLTPLSTPWQRHLPSQPKISLPHVRNTDITSQSFNRAFAGLGIDSMAMIEAS